MNLPEIFYSVQELDRLIRTPRFVSTTPFSTMEKLEMILVSAIDHFQPLLRPEMVRIQSEKEELKSSIKKLVEDIQEIEETLEPKKMQLLQFRTDLETLVDNEKTETSPFKMNQTIEEIKAHLIEEITGSSASSSSVKSKSNRCQISRNGLIGINSAFENCLRSAETFGDLDESSCWTLLKEVGISLEKIGKIEAKLVGSKKKDPLKSMMVDWAENLLVAQILEELDGLVDGEEASRLMLSLRMISKGLKIVRLPHWMMVTAAAKPDDERQPENLFEICADEGNSQKECDQIVTLMERAGIFSRDVTAKDEIEKQITANSISPIQLLMRIDDLVLLFPVKHLTKDWMKKFLKKQRRQMMDELDDHLKRLESPKATLDADGNQICLFIRASSSAEPTTTRLKYLTTSAGLSVPSKDKLEKRGGKIDASAETHRIFEKVRLLVSEIRSILLIGVFSVLDQFFNSIYEAKERIRPNKLRSLDGCTKITELNLSGFGIQSIPGEIGQMTNLQTLGLSQNQLTSIPAEIGQLTNLQTLYLHQNQLTSIPAEIGQLTNLQTLILWRNQLTSIPAEIGQLTNLQTFKVYKNQLTSIPAEIGQLTNLQTLGLSQNQLTSIPAEIGQLTNLQTLKVYKNQLTSIPAEIGQLMNLKYLGLSQNQLTSIPGEIGQLTNLQTLNLEDNPNLPAEFRKRSHVFYANLKNLGNFYA